MESTAETLISEQIIPVPGSFDSTATSRGEPALPLRFTWRGREFEVVEVLERAKGYGPCPSGEIYLRRHYYTVRTDDGRVMKIYFERQARTPGDLNRWWLYTLQTPGGGRGYRVCGDE